MAISTVLVPEVAVIIAPKLRRRLLLDCKAYAGLKAQAADIKADMDALNASIESTREEIGETSVGLEGFKVTRVFGTTSKLDHKKLKAQGVTDAQIEAATVITPKKAYTLVSVPGQREFHTREDQ
jgi:hypothetical protein